MGGVIGILGVIGLQCDAHVVDVLVVDINNAGLHHDLGGGGVYGLNQLLDTLDGERGAVHPQLLAVIVCGEMAIGGKPGIVGLIDEGF